MVVGDIIDGLKAIKEIIVTLKNEVDALEKIKKDNVGKVITFSHSLYAINDAIDNILDVLIDEKETGDINITLINTLKHKIEEFTKFLVIYREWCENMEGNCCVRCKTTIKNPPSKIEKQMNEEIDKCQDINEKIIEIQDKTVGSASKINNKIMKKAWIYGLGKNQLNETQLHIDILATNIFTLLLKDGGELKNKDLYRDIVYSFLKSIDNISITPPDSIIQINEINLYLDSNKLHNSTLKELLNLKKEVKEESVDIPIEFTKMKIDSKSGIEMPKKDERYGSGFNNKKACTFKVPELKEGEDVFSVIVECNACDQGWGGTGHAQIRYQINNGIVEPSINIWRKGEVKDNNYKMTLTDVKAGDEVSIWMYCPAWNGWECNLNSVKACVILC